MMRMQPTPAFEGTLVSSDSGGKSAPVAIELSDVSVTFGRGERAVPALAKTTLRIADGEFVALVGPSGCGKSTILRLVSGLVQPPTGAGIGGGAGGGRRPKKPHDAAVDEDQGNLPAAAKSGGAVPFAVSETAAHSIPRQ